MDRGKFAPKGAENYKGPATPRPVDARGIYGNKHIEEPGDFIAAGIKIGYEAAVRTWGQERADSYWAARNDQVLRRTK